MINCIPTRYFPKPSCRRLLLVAVSRTGSLEGEPGYVLSLWQTRTGGGREGNIPRRSEGIIAFCIFLVTARRSDVGVYHGSQARRGWQGRGR